MKAAIASSMVIAPRFLWGIGERFFWDSIP
jgi:hypothetical protein